MLNKSFYFILLCALTLYNFNVHSQVSANDQSESAIWPKVKIEHRPGTYWWWMGSAVDKENLTYNLETLRKAGMGGVTIVPIYGVKGNEPNYIDYLSPEWMEMLIYTVTEAKRLDMWVDMTTGTGWPFGGTHVTPKHAAKKIEHKIYRLSKNQQIDDQFKFPGWALIIAYSQEGEVLDLSNKLEKNGIVNWKAPAGEWDVYVIWETGTGQKVKRAAPGNYGLVLDPFSVNSLQYYLKRFDNAFKGYENQLPRAQYHDSYEYYHANWTNNFLDAFKTRHGYDLKEHLALIFSKVASDTVSRIKSDFRETLALLHLEYIKKWRDWAHRIGCLTKDQAHGAPGNLLDLYATADIPETETFGSTPFKIPGLRRRPENIGRDAPNPLVLKFASSAAHVTGKSLVASETCTWLRDHYKSALSQVKPEIDQLFLAGINHIFYHGNAYSPKDSAWPGWLFYASTHFEPENAFWRDFPALNAYVTKCQSILQSGQPANDLLIYWPVYDIWHSGESMIRQLTVHKIEWFTESDFGDIAADLHSHGYSFDYISDKQLLQIECENDIIKSQGGEYKTVIVPECKHIPLETWLKLNQLAKDGADILIKGSLPADVPGLADLERKRTLLKKSQSDLNFKQLAGKDFKSAKVDQGQLVLGDDLKAMLDFIGVRREKVVDKGVGYIRRMHKQGYYYFFANLEDKIIDGWVPLSVPFKSVFILDPLTGHSGIAASRNLNNTSEIYLQLQPGQSCIIKTYESEIKKGTHWRYLRSAGTSFKISGNWKVDFIQGGPSLPESFTTKKLHSWTDLDDEEAKRFAGTARYNIALELPDYEVDDWIIDLGRVCESARITINDNQVGTLWSIPFNFPVGKFLKKGKNELSIEVTNISANRVADLDRRKVLWKNFHDINFVNIHYKPFDASTWDLMDSGLLGPVILYPVNLMALNEEKVEVIKKVFNE